LLGYAFMLKMNYGWLVAAQYQSSLAFIYPLGFSAITFAVVAFFDMGYQCAKDTARTLPAIVLAAVVNVVLNVVLTPRWGVWGPIATLIATNGVLVLYRWHDMKRYMRLTLSPRLLVPLATLVVGAVAFYTLHWLWADALAMTLLIAVALGAMPAQLRNDLLTPILSKFHRSTH
jgi:O-antigen/teichoic acid export membrane protein